MEVSTILKIFIIIVVSYVGIFFIYTIIDEFIIPFHRNNLRKRGKCTFEILLDDLYDSYGVDGGYNNITKENIIHLYKANPFDDKNYFTKMINNLYHTVSSSEGWDSPNNTEFNFASWKFVRWYRDYKIGYNDDELPEGLRPKERVYIPPPIDLDYRGK